MARESQGRTVPTVLRARALLAGVTDGGKRGGADEAPLAELARLVETAGAEVAGRLIQHRQRPDPRSFLGRGKVAELAAQVQALKADIVVFDNDLAPSQLQHLEDEVHCRVLDRTELILELFALRARTRQAKTQVELARLEYQLPRLRRMWTHLERQVGGIGVRGGPGERQLEMDRRRLRWRIKLCRAELDGIARQREQIVRSHRSFFTVSLVGYTNTGKSTLLTALTGAAAFAEDRLFATLDTQTRGLDLPGGQRVLVSDTVGFIRRLPPGLIASFHATLAEARAADLLLHVVDFAAPGCLDQIAVVEETLREVGCGEKPLRLVANKIDLLTDRAELRVFLERHAGSVAVSARTGEGLEGLRAALRESAQASTVEETLAIAAGDGRTLAFLDQFAEVLEREYAGEELRLRVRLHPAHRAQLVSEGGRVRLRAGGGPQGRLKKLQRRPSGR